MVRVRYLMSRSVADGVLMDVHVRGVGQAKQLNIFIETVGEPIRAPGRPHFVRPSATKFQVSATLVWRRGATL